MKLPLNLLLVISLCCLVSCSPIEDLEDFDTVAYEASYAFPLVNARVSLDDILENFQDEATLVVDPNGLFHFRYSGEVLSQTGSEIFLEIENGIEALSNVTPDGIPVLTQQLSIPFIIPGGVELDKIRLKAGELKYQFRNTNSEAVDIVVRMPQFFKEGQALEFTHQLDGFAAGSEPPSFSNEDMPFDMNGVEVIPQNGAINIEYTATTVNSQQQVPLSSFFVKIDDAALTYAEGFLGTTVYDGPVDTIKIDFFEDWIGEDVAFEEPRVAYILENAFGIPTRSIVDSFNVITVEGQTLPLESELIENGIDFPYPTLEEIGQTKSSVFVFTKDNSNIDEILSSNPVEVRYDVDALTHPDGNRNIRGFLTDSSFYRVGVDVDLPFIGSAANFIARDTFDFSPGELEQLDSIELKFIAENAIPIAIDVQFYLADENNVILDSLFDQQTRLVEAAPVNSNGDVIDSVSKTTFVDIGGSRVEAFTNTDKLLLVASFSTTNDGTVPVKIFNNQFFDIKLGGIFKFVNE